MNYKKNLKDFFSLCLCLLAFVGEPSEALYSQTRVSRDDFSMNIFPEKVGHTLYFNNGDGIGSLINRIDMKDYFPRQPDTKQDDGFYIIFHYNTLNAQEEAVLFDFQYKGKPVLKGTLKNKTIELVRSFGGTKNLSYSQELYDQLFGWSFDGVREGNKVGVGRIDENTSGTRVRVSLFVTNSVIFIQTTTPGSMNGSSRSQTIYAHSPIYWSLVGEKGSENENIFEKFLNGDDDASITCYNCYTITSDKDPDDFVDALDDVGMDVDSRPRGQWSVKVGMITYDWMQGKLNALAASEMPPLQFQFDGQTNNVFKRISISNDSLRFEKRSQSKEITTKQFVIKNISSETITVSTKLAKAINFSFDDKLDKEQKLAPNDSIIRRVTFSSIASDRNHLDTVIVSVNGATESSILLRGRLTSLLVSLFGSEDDISETKLKSIYPNPTSDILNVAFSVNETANIEIKVYDMLGRNVALLVNRSFNRGYHSVSQSMIGYSSGVYFVIFKHEKGIEKQKVFVVK